MKPIVSITIVLYNSADVVGGCLQSIGEAVKSGFAELVIVDNASPDASMEVVDRADLPAKRIVATSNRGFAAGCNSAWPLAEGDYWLLLNPDVRVPVGGLEMLVDWLNRHPDVGAVSPEIEDLRGARRSPGQRFPSAALTLFEASRLHLLLSRRTRGELLRGSYWTGGDQLDVDWVPGTCLLVRREAVEHAGLLAEDFFMYGEDIEWCRRLRRAGWKVGVSSAVAFLHDEGSSTIQSFGVDETRRLVARGICEACRRIRGPIRAKGFAVSQALSLAIESVMPDRSKEHRSRARAFARAYWEILVGGGWTANVATGEPGN